MDLLLELCITSLSSLLRISFFGQVVLSGVILGFIAYLLQYLIKERL